MTRRTSLLAPPETIAPPALRMLRDAAYGRGWLDPHLRGTRHFGWGGQRAQSARYAATPYAIVDGRHARDAEAFRTLLAPLGFALPRDEGPFPEAAVAEALTRAAAAALTPVRFADYWWKLGHPVERLTLLRAVGPGGEALADVSLPLLGAVARALGWWERATVTGPSGTVVLWVDGAPAAALTSLDFGLPEIWRPAAPSVAGPPDFRAPKLLASDAERAAWVGRAADALAKHFGGRHFDATPLRPDHWAVAGRAGTLRFELVPPPAGGAWQFLGAEEPWGASRSDPPYFFRPAWEVLGSWDELPAALGRRLSAMAAPADDRPPPWALVPPPAPRERYQLAADGARWRVVDGHAEGAPPLRGAWTSLPQARAMAFRLNAATGLAAASRLAHPRLLGAPG